MNEAWNWMKGILISQQMDDCEKGAGGWHAALAVDCHAVILIQGSFRTRTIKVDRIRQYIGRKSLQLFLAAEHEKKYHERK